MTELVDYPLEAGKDRDRVRLFLRRMPNDGAPPVLLLHGASAQSGSFLVPGPDADGNPRALAPWLHRNGFEPWLLDWRGSCLVVREAERKGVLDARPEAFDFDRVARFDIPEALRAIRSERKDAEGIGAVGHCMGAGTLAQALASGSVTRNDHDLTHVVLLTLGLFYEPTVESRLKAQTYTLWDLQQHGDPPVRDVDPHRPLEKWPLPLRSLYARTAAEPHPDPDSHAHEICNRLTFMYGAPYAEEQLVPEIHADTWTLRFESGRRLSEPGERVRGAQSGATATVRGVELRSGRWGDGDAAGVVTLEGAERPAFRAGEELAAGDLGVARVVTAHFSRAELPSQFGAIPLQMYSHGAQNVRRRWAAPYGSGKNDTSLVARERARAFVDQLDAITLVTGRENRLWQPKGLHDMHEWLTSGSPDARKKCTRHVESGFAHQDLLWGAEAPRRIFRKIHDGLRGLLA